MMSWTQWLVTVGVLVVTNFFSLTIIFGVSSALNEKREREKLKGMIDDLEKKIVTELNFIDIVQNFDDDDEHDRERE